MLPPDVEALAAEVVLVLKQSLAPVVARLEALEQRAATADGLWNGMLDQAATLRTAVEAVREKAITLEARPVAVVPDLAPVVERVIRTETRLEDLQQASAKVDGAVAQWQQSIIAILDRVAILDARPPLPGPPGPPGVDGAPGVPGMEYLGVFQEGKTYRKGAVVTWGGQMYHCQKDETLAKPAEFGPDWQLCVKRGRDGKDAK